MQEAAHATIEDLVPGLPAVPLSCFGIRIISCPVETKSLGIIKVVTRSVIAPVNAEFGGVADTI